MSVMLIQKPIFGIILIMSASALIIAMGGFAKLISDYYDPVETVFIRNFVSFIIVTLFLISTNKTYAFRTKKIKSHIVRTIAGTIGLSLAFLGFTLLPMATMQSLMLTGGIMTAGLAPIALKEHVDAYRWLAVTLGFIGAIIIIQPSSDGFLGWQALIGVFAAFFGGTLVGFFLRSLGKTESAWTSLFYFLFIGTAITLPYCLWTKMQYHEEALLGIIGVSITGGLSLLLKTQAYRHAEASFLSPFTYFSLIWAILFGWIGFNETPDEWVIIGGGLIIVSNLFILYREKKKVSL